MIALAIGIRASGKPIIFAACNAITVRIHAFGFARPISSYAVVINLLSKDSISLALINFAK